MACQHKIDLNQKHKKTKELKWLLIGLPDKLIKENSISEFDGF
jgi:hypothetical protein